MRNTKRTITEASAGKLARLSTGATSAEILTAIKAETANEECVMFLFKSVAVFRLAKKNGGVDGFSRVTLLEINGNKHAEISGRPPGITNYKNAWRWLNSQIEESI